MKVRIDEFDNTKNMPQVPKDMAGNKVTYQVLYLKSTVDSDGSLLASVLRRISVAVARKTEHLHPQLRFPYVANSLGYFEPATTGLYTSTIFNITMPTCCEFPSVAHSCGQNPLTRKSPQRTSPCDMPATSPLYLPVKLHSRRDRRRGRRTNRTNRRSLSKAAFKG